MQRPDRFRTERKTKPREERVIVLDFLPHGKPPKNQPIVQAIGMSRFGLLELVPKPEISVMPGEELYVGEGKRDKVHHITGKIKYEDLSGNAQSELQYAVEKIVEQNEMKFVEFFSKSQAIALRRHALELLPGLGKKHMWDIIEERREGDFESFENIKARLKSLPDPKTAVIKRILEELKNEENFYLFVDK